MKDTLKFDCLQQPVPGLDLTTGIGGVGGLGDRQAQALGVEAHLGDVDEVGLSDGWRGRQRSTGASCGH